MSTRDVPVPAGFDIRRHLSGIGAQLAGQANVILQLSRPEIGYGVMNSRVHDGSAMLHPVKRARTTFTYLAVAMLGTDAERSAYRRAVTGQHAQVASTPAPGCTGRSARPRPTRSTPTARGSVRRSRCPPTRGRQTGRPSRPTGR